MTLPELDKVLEIGNDFYLGEMTLNIPAAEYSRDELCQLLRALSDDLSDLVGRMTPEQVAYRKPGTPEGWDASGDESHFDTSQIITHLAQSYGYFWLNVTRALKQERPPLNRPPQGARVTGTQGKAEGRGGWSGVAPDDLKNLLHDTADSFIRYIKSLPPGADLQAQAPFGRYGDLTAKAWLLLASVHTANHLVQLKEMQAQPDYPA